MLQVAEPVGEATDDLGLEEVGHLLRKRLVLPVPKEGQRLCQDLHLPGDQCVNLELEGRTLIARAAFARDPTAQLFM